MVKIILLMLVSLIASGCGPLTPNINVHTDGHVDTSGTITVSPIMLYGFFELQCQQTQPADIQSCVSQNVNNFIQYTKGK